MRKLTIAAAIACTFTATAANARDGSPYVGLDFGLTKPQATSLSFSNATDSATNALKVYHKVGFDGDFLVGYDFGMFRLEGEAAYKRANLKRSIISLQAAQSVGNPNLTGEIPTSGHVTVGSGMINALLDLGGPGVSGSIGAGVGYARVRYSTDMSPSSALAFRDEDAAFAYQLLAEVRAPVSDNIDVGLKYRYFMTDRLDYGPFCQTSCGTIAPYALSGKYKSSSLLASLTYNLGSVAPPPPPPPPAPPPPPPPPPAPATQTCPDGSVILATDACPAPPPPPPPPAPAPERGN